MQQNVTNEKMYPVLSLVLYKPKGEYSASYYVESRKIEKTAKGYVMQAPTPLSEEVFESITKDFRKYVGSEMKHDSIIGEHILYAKNDSYPKIVWYTKAQKIQMNFVQGFIKGTKSTTAWIPPCLFVLIKNDLYVYALESDNRPKSTDKLYCAPFLNVYSDGKICLGTANVGNKKAATYEREAERYQIGFFMAEQNGGHESNRKGKTPIAKLWSKLIKSGSKFPVNELVAHPKVKTVGDVITKLGRAKNEHE